MKDRLSELHRVTPKPGATESRHEDQQTSEHEGSLELLEQEAIVFNGEDKMDCIYKEAQSMRKEIRFLASVRRMSSIKRDSNTLGRSIKARGEAIYARLDKLGKRSKELEEEYGPTAALVRMVRSQYISLTIVFQEAISEYNEAEMAQKENCKTCIQRQAEIMGKQVTGEQIDEMIETGKWNVFSDNLLTDGRAARSALTEIENRHKELLELEGRIRDIHDLFFQMAMLVEEQGCMLDNIESNVGATLDYVVSATTDNSFFCCCFPCCNK